MRRLLRKAKANLSEYTRMMTGIQQNNVASLENPVVEQEEINVALSIKADLPTHQTDEELAGIELQEFKADLAVQVAELIVAQNLVHTSLVLREVDWFFFNMGIEDSYFPSTPAQDIATHISSLYAERILAQTGNWDQNFRHAQETEDRAFFFTRSVPLSGKTNVFELESLIETKYLMEGYSGNTHAKTDTPYRLKVFRSSGAMSPDLDVQVRFYLLHKPVFPEQYLDEDLSEVTELSRIADVDFLKRSSTSTKSLYQTLVERVVAGHYPVVHDVEGESGRKERRVCLGYRHGSIHSVLSFFTDLYHGLKLFCTKKFVEQFANGVAIMCVYVRPTEDISGEECSELEFMQRINRLKEGLFTLLALPRTSLTPLFRESLLSAGEVTYAYCAWKFAHQFLSKYQVEYSALQRSLLAHDPASMGHLLKLKTNLRKDTFTESRVIESMKRYLDFLKVLFADFEQRFAQPKSESSAQQVLRYQQLQEQIQTTANSEFDLIVLTAVLSFNKHIVRTNFFKRAKSALSFRMDPAFLSQDEYPEAPFAVFFLVGSEFRGFHVRFRDVSRGGVRLVCSRNEQDFAQAVGSIFDENYNLANTQQRKNKDIPEGGSKGTILLALAHRDKGELAFRKYVDALLDLVLPAEGSGEGEEDIVFLGPDEGTAEFMDWASAHARKRGAGFWKAFTTGKSMALGGIPHDTFGMTTRGVRAYVEGVLEKLGLDQKAVTKFQTGGPDGDLGSNEILMSTDKTTSIVDGSGVLHDPLGIDRKELTRLARARKPVREFAREKLSANGFFVDVEDREIQLPNGVLVPNGLLFRNTFHLSPLAAADVFVPCGGRPEAVDINNVSLLLETDGTSRFKVIVEGANLFFTQGARLLLEKAGVILYKDASANKGGVTSSSLEVLAALALTDEEFAQHMAVPDHGDTPEFYQAYVKEVQEIIARNALLEFACIWEEHTSTGTPRSIISDQLSNKINQLSESMIRSQLWDDQRLREKVIRAHCPRVLVNTIGFDTLCERVPLAYLKAIFGSQLASIFVYQHGINHSEFAFFEFMQQYRML